TQGVAKSLLGKLNTAVQKLSSTSNGFSGAEHVLEAFINSVEHWLSTGTLSAEEAEELIADAELIIYGITNGVDGLPSETSLDLTFTDISILEEALG
ncbi:MAG: hypothetical protein KDA78_19840, partial [Planctomycetaceae bacterium]|nr:hypothetical protein [Planctomycetaceae bacterium]